MASRPNRPLPAATARTGVPTQKPLAIGWRILAVVEVILGGYLCAMGAIPLVMGIVSVFERDPDPRGQVLFLLGATAFVPLGVSLVMAAYSIWRRWRYWRALQLAPLIVVVVVAVFVLLL